MTRMDNVAHWRACFFVHLETRLNAALEALESMDDPAPGDVDFHEVALALAAAAATIRALRDDCLDRSWTGFQN